MRLQCIMCPANARIGASYNNILSSEPECPYIRRMRVTDTRLDRRGPLERWWSLTQSLRLRQLILDLWIAFYSRHIRAGCQRLCNLSRSLHQDCVNNVKGAIFNPAFA